MYHEVHISGTNQQTAQKPTAYSNNINAIGNLNKSKTESRVPKLKRNRPACLATSYQKDLKKGLSKKLTCTNTKRGRGGMSVWTKVHTGKERRYYLLQSGLGYCCTSQVDTKKGKA